MSLYSNYRSRSYYLSYPLTSRYKLTLSAAACAIDVLQREGIASAVVGGLACKLYGNDRDPNDVDLLALPSKSQSYTTDELKRIIERASPTHFILKPSKKRFATYKILYFRKDPSIYSQEVKVDILIPGIMNIPDFSTSYIYRASCEDMSITLPSPRNATVDDIPLAPLSLCLLLKLQSWHDHKHAAEWYHGQKQFVDVRDLECMLKLDNVRALKVDNKRWWKDKNLFDNEFVELTRKRLKELLVVQRGMSDAWKLVL